MKLKNILWKYLQRLWLVFIKSSITEAATKKCCSAVPKTKPVSSYGEMLGKHLWKSLFLVNLPANELFSMTHSYLFSIYLKLYFLPMSSSYVPYESCFPFLITMTNIIKYKTNREPRLALSCVYPRLYIIGLYINFDINLYIFVQWRFIFHLYFSNKIEFDLKSINQ